MAKGPIITEEVQNYIKMLYIRHPHLRAEDIRGKVNIELRKKDPKIDTEWPGLSAIQKILAPIRIKVGTLPLDPNEKDWSLATLDEHPVPYEAIPAVLKVWKFRIETKSTLTIREAKWAARLSGVLSDTKQLSFKASQYSRTELMYMLIDSPFDSTNLDRLLMELELSITGDSKSFFPLLAEQEDGIEQLQDYIRGKRKGLSIYPFGKPQGERSQ